MSFNEQTEFKNVQMNNEIALRNNIGQKEVKGTELKMSV